ncbi:DDB1- and CUL4-associated factor 5-like [Amphiura filiformis]|uniref:DDB1- and CUL4-associated factor 5-like n=1 Tax=Amphiura filiformis TaxID=82378 RepID=UPI003B20F4A3
MSLRTNMPRKKRDSVVDFLFEREKSKDVLLRRRFVRERIAHRSTLYKKDLVGHYGCVNAIEFSNNGGNLLASGGDDRRILLWNMEKTLSGGDKKAFVAMKGEHHSNIFSVAFDSQNTKIYSGGNDDQVLVHDVQTGDTQDLFLHEDAVYGLAVDPRDNHIYASACADGRVLLWDTRVPSSQEPFVLANYTTAFHAVVYHPMEPRYLATANSKEGVALWDVRAPRSCLMRYGSSHTQQNAMSVRFNQMGTRLVALRRRLPPVVYNIQSSGAAVQFDHSGYYNSCTMKSCCFAGDKDQYVVSGSDDFNLYMWRVPEQGEEKGWVAKAQIVMSGHRSIVNQVRYNPYSSLVASSGVEKVVKIWSPFCAPEMTEEDDHPRKMFSHQQYINLVINTGTGLAHDYTSQSTDEDPRMIAFFDSLVQREVDRSFSDSDDSELSPDALYLNFAAEESESSHESESESSISSFQASLIRMSELARDEDDSGNSDSNVMLLFSGKRKKDEDESGDGSDEESHSKKRKGNRSQDRQGTSSENQSDRHSKSEGSSGAKRKHDAQARHSSSEDSSSSDDDDDDESLDVQESRIKSRIMRRLASKHKRLKRSASNDGEMSSHRFRRMQSQLDHDRMINLRQRWAYCKALKARMARSQEEPRLVVGVPNEDNLDIIAEHLDRSASREQRAAISRLRRRVLQEESVQDSPESHELSQSVKVPSSPDRGGNSSHDQTDNTKAKSSRGESSKVKPEESKSQSSRKGRCSKCNANQCKCNTSTVDKPTTSSNCNNTAAAGGSEVEVNEANTEQCKDFKRLKKRITRAKSKRQYRTNSNAEKSRRDDESDSD